MLIKVSGGIYIDYGCSGIVRIGEGVFIPTGCWNIDIDQAFQEDLAAFLGKWFGPMAVVSGSCGEKQSPS